MFKDGLLQGKRVLVTGGGTGPGREMPFKFAERGADLFLCGRRKDVVQATAQENDEDADWQRMKESIRARDAEDKVPQIYDRRRAG